MQIKKLTSLTLIFSFLVMFASPLSAETPMSKKSLYDFMKTTDKITATYKYPSMKLAYNESGKSMLPAHTPIIIRCTDTITTKDVVSGGTVNFSVLNNVKNESGTVLIRAGAPVTAQITFASNKGMIGKSGVLTITDFHTNAVDGTYIPLSGSISANPDDKMTLSIVLSVLICPLFLLMKGDEAYTIIDTYVRANRL